LLGWFADDGIFICGKSRNSPVIERPLALNVDGDPSDGCVVASYLESIGDVIHFDALSPGMLGLMLCG